MNIGQILGIGVAAGAAASVSKVIADKVCDYFFHEEEILPIQAPGKKPARKPKKKPVKKGKKKPARKPKKKPAKKGKKKPASKPKKKPAKVKKTEAVATEQ